MYIYIYIYIACLVTLKSCDATKQFVSERKYICSNARWWST